MLCDYVVGSQRQHVLSHCWHAGCVACVQHATQQPVCHPNTPGRCQQCSCRAAGWPSGKCPSIAPAHKTGCPCCSPCMARRSRRLRRTSPAAPDAKRVCCRAELQLWQARQATLSCCRVHLHPSSPHILLPATTHLARGTITLPGLAGGRCAGPGGYHTAVRAGVTNHADALAVGGGVARDLRAREGRRVL